MLLVASVPPSGTLRSEIRPSPRAERWENSPPEENKSVDTDQDVAVGVDFQEVSIHGVKHKPPEHASKEISKGGLRLIFLFPHSTVRFLK